MAGLQGKRPRRWNEGTRLSAYGPVNGVVKIGRYVQFLFIPVTTCGDSRAHEKCMSLGARFVFLVYTVFCCLFVLPDLGFFFLWPVIYIYFFSLTLTSLSQVRTLQLKGKKLKSAWNLWWSLSKRVCGIWSAMNSLNIEFVRSSDISRKLGQWHHYKEGVSSQNIRAVYSLQSNQVCRRRIQLHASWGLWMPSHSR